jgi:hypothetical protein
MATNEQVLRELEDLRLANEQRRIREEEFIKKLDAMYKVLVTGNGGPPLPELVRGNKKWIDDQDADRKEREKERRSFNRTIAILALGQVVTLLVAIFVK